MEHLDDAIHLDMTGHLKEQLSHLIGQSVSWIEDNKDKEVFNGSTVRSMLQRFGNDIIKDLLFKDYWMQERLSVINQRSAKFTVLSGIRMVREMEYFSKNFLGPDKRVIVLKVNRLNEDGTQFEGLTGSDRYHITETDVERIIPDTLIEASGMRELKEETLAFYQSL